MYIVYDDLIEAGEVLRRCERTEKARKCRFCPLFLSCVPVDKSARIVFHGRTRAGEAADEALPVFEVEEDAR